MRICAYTKTCVPVMSLLLLLQAVVTPSSAPPQGGDGLRAMAAMQVLTGHGLICHWTFSAAKTAVRTSKTQRRRKRTSALATSTTAAAGQGS